jgi:hypothetical protein
MTYHTQHQRMRPVLDLARKLDIATNPALEALFEAGCGGFQIWCISEDHPKGWDEVQMSKGAFSKPCAYVASVTWGWEGESITHLELETDAYDLRAIQQHPPRIRNRPDDIAWAKAKIKLLFSQAGVKYPPIWVEK